MNQENIHLSDEDLLCAADGELMGLRMAEVQEHLAACWSCRARLREIERTVADFVHLRETMDFPMPSPERGRARLEARMAERARFHPLGFRERLLPVLRRQPVHTLAYAALILAVAGAFVFSDSEVAVQAIPDPRLTPGVALPLTRDDVCTPDVVESARVVPRDVAKAVFAAYGIREPQPRAYEVDYLITPALGGSDNVRNFWPQSYRNTVWNAHIKDALEDHLHRLVCDGHLDLTTAQQDISRDWVAAYKKYFRTSNPLAEHAAFLKDRPWE